VQQTLGTVVKVEGERVWIQTVRTSTCGACGVKGACGTHVLARLFSERNAPIELTSPLPLKVGDQVMLSLSEHALLKQSLWAYGAPLAGFFIGGLMLQPISELAAVIGALFGMGAGWWCTARWAVIEKPTIRKVIPIQGGMHAEVD